MIDIYEQLRRDEGVRLKPYTDTIGKLTIGVGRNLTDNGIADDESDVLLHNDVTRVDTELTDNLHFYPSLDTARKGVLLNMCFNMGIVRLQGFAKMLNAIANQDWDTAAIEMLDSLWAQQVGDRATRLAQQMREGVWV